MGLGVLLWGHENVWELNRWLYNIVTVLIATELYTFSWLILCYVAFT